MGLDALRARYPGAETFRFGDSKRLSDEILALVREGRKTATCGALRDFGEGGEAMPAVGRRDIALDWDGTPAVVVETVEVETRAFEDVDEAFATDEGEFADLADWQEGHRRYFERNGGFEPGMMLVCERFRLVEDLG